MDAKNIRVLIVDDFEMYRTILSNILGDMGYTNCQEAEDGSKALEKIVEAHGKGEPYDLIFCDWNMPEMMGIDLLEALRCTPEFKKLPFIMVTAEAEQFAVVKALKMGATDYIIKPVAPDILARKVEKILKFITQKSA